MSELTQGEQKLIECYESLAGVLRDYADELPPFAQRNATKALAALWQVANGYDRDPGQVYELGV
ncbi:MAG TPA: hypothetical protein VEA19_01295 [Actinomycetota bacterium]|nr:hypothetical protein [Actinomycetota bacterium]